MKMHPRSAPEAVASYYYRALPETIRDQMSQEDFAEKLEEMLIDTGDLDENSKLATKQGELHGFHNSVVCDWDDQIEQVTHAAAIVRAGKSAQEYIKAVVELHYPDFDEEKYSEIRNGLGRRVREYTFLASNVFTISEKAKYFAEDLAKGRLQEWVDGLVYICLDEQDIAPFLYVFQERIMYENREEERKAAVIMSGEGISLAVKEEKYKGHNLTGMLHSGVDHDNIIYHFEKITDPDTQEAMGEQLFSAMHGNADLWSKYRKARFILIATLMPYEYHIQNEKLRKFIFSAPSFDLRGSKTIEDDINRVVLKGRIISAPHFLHSPTNTSIIEFTLADDAEQHSNPTVHSFKCLAYYDKADYVFCNFQEGDSVIVLGKLQNYNWTDEEGKTSSEVALICENVYAVPEKIVQTGRDDEHVDEEE